MLQLGFLLMMVVTFVTPLAECFDRWDAPGLGNDTEFALFLVVFLLCLVLVVAMLVALRALERQSVLRLLLMRAKSFITRLVRVLSLAIVPHDSPPLRI